MIRRRSAVRGLIGWKTTFTRWEISYKLKKVLFRYSLSPNVHKQQLRLVYLLLALVYLFIKSIKSLRRSVWRRRSFEVDAFHSTLRSAVYVSPNFWFRTTFHYENHENSRFHLFIGVCKIYFFLPLSRRIGFKSMASRFSKWLLRWLRERRNARKITVIFPSLMSY